MSMDVQGLLWKGGGLRAAFRWHAGRALAARPWLLNLLRARLTIFDAFGAPGDTLLSATVCRNVKQSYPRIRLNLITPNPDLVEHDPNLDGINRPESYVCVWQSYLELIEHKDGRTNILQPVFRHLGMPGYDYHARVFLTDGEIAAAGKLLPGPGLPVFAFNTLSKEVVKNWPLDSWLAAIEKLRAHFTLVHLGDAREPEIPGVLRFAGRLKMRESMAMLAHARLYAGPDSFLMHAANGLGIPSVVIFGGSRTPENLGYKDNVNLFAKMPCGPCWIHESRGEKCAHGLECMQKISVADVCDAILRLARERHVLPAE